MNKKNCATLTMNKKQQMQESGTMAGNDLKANSNDMPSGCDLLLLPSSDEWVDEWTPDKTIRTQTRKRILLFTLIALGLVSLILGCAYRDLKQPLKQGTSKFELKQVRLDASQSLPSASFEFEFDYGSRLSKVTPTSLDCIIALRNEGNEPITPATARIHAPIKVVEGKERESEVDTSKKTSFVADASCPKEDVVTHADIVWSQVEAVLNHPENRKSVDWSCNVEFRIDLFSWIPVMHQVSVEEMISTYNTKPSQDIQLAQANDDQQNEMEPSQDLQEKETHPAQKQTKPSRYFGHEHVELAQDYKQNGMEPSQTFKPIDFKKIQFKTAEDEKEIDMKGQEDTWIIREANLQTLELARMIQLPPHFLAQVSDGIQIHLPALTLEARAPNSSANGNLISLFQFPGMDHRFALEKNEPAGSSEMDWITLDSASMSQSSPKVDALLKPASGQNEFWAVLSLSCASEDSGSSQDDCKWMNPMTDWYSKAKEAGENEPTSVFLTVDSQGSFLEQVLGRNHALQIQWHTASTSHGEVPSARRHLNPSPIQTELDQAQADCLGVTLDEAANLDVGLCWVLQASKGFSLAGQLSVYDFGAQGVVESKWSTAEDNKFTMTSTALLDVDEEDDPSVMNMTNLFVLDWNEDDAVTMEMDMDNTGSWKPFKGEFQGNGSVLGNIASANLNKGVFTLEGDTRFDLTGSFVFNADDISLTMALEDPAEDIDCILNAMVDVDEEYFDGSTTCLWKGDNKWDVNTMVSIRDNGYSANITESLSNFKISSITRWDIIEDNFTSDAIIVNFDEISLRWDEGSKSLDWVGEYYQSFDDSSIRFHMIDSGFLGIAMNFTGQWANVYEDQDFFELIFDKWLLEWKGETRIDGETRLFLDFDNSIVNFTLSDTAGIHDIQVDSSMSWLIDDFTDRFQLFFDRVILEWDDEIQGQLTGNLDFNVDTSSFAITVEDTQDETDVVDFLTTWVVPDIANEDKFVLSLERFMLQWDGEKHLDLSSELMIDYDASAISFSMEDRGRTEFSLMHSVDWGEPTSGQFDGLVNFDKAFFQVGSEIKYDSTMTFGWYDTANDDFFFVMNATSSPSASLQMEMACEFQYDNDLDLFRMIMDHMHVTWEGEQRFDVGGKFATDGDDGPTTDKSPSPAPVDDTNDVEIGMTEVTIAGIEMTLSGAKEEMDDATIEIFESALEDHYRSFHSPLQESRKKPGVRRTLEETADTFDTEVTVTSQAINERGNAVKYDQKLIFLVTSEDEGGEVLTAQILVAGALKEEVAREQLLATLKENEQFNDISSVEAPVVPNDDDGDVDDDTDSSKTKNSGSVASGISNLLGTVLLAVLLGFARWQ